MPDPLRVLADSLSGGSPPPLAWLVEHSQDTTIDPVVHAWQLSIDGSAMLDLLDLINRRDEVPFEIRVKLVGRAIADHINWNLNKPSFSEIFLRQVLHVYNTTPIETDKDKFDEIMKKHDEHNEKMDLIEQDIFKEIANEIKKLNVKPPTLAELLATLQTKF